MLLMVSRRPSITPLLLLPLLAVAAYQVALDNPFIYDDVSAIAGNELIRRVRFAASFLLGTSTTDGFAAHQFRPLVLLSFSLNYLWGQASPFTYRLVNLTLHAANVVLAAVVLRRILRAFPLTRGGLPLDENRASWAAVLGAALMAVHPVHSMAVLLVWKRATLMAGVFTLGAVLCFLRLRGIGGECAAGRGRRRLLVAGVLGGQLLALASKEIAVATPALLALLELWPRPDRPAWDRTRVSLAARLHVAVLALTIVFALCLYPSGYAHGTTLSRWSYLAAQCKVVWLYAAMIFDPGLLSAAYSIDSSPRGQVVALLGGAGIVAAAVAAVALARRAPLPTLAFAWAAAALLPSSSLIPIPLVVDEDRMYLPMLLAWGTGGALAIRLAAGTRARRSAMLGCAVLVLCATTAATIARGVLWSSPVQVWLDAVEKHPRSLHANGNVCDALAREPRLAVQACGRALVLFPDSAPIRQNLIGALLSLGRLDDAQRLVDEGLRRNGDQLAAVAGDVARARGNAVRAVTLYQRALARQPWDVVSSVTLARSLVELGRVDEARHIAGELDEHAVATDAATRLAMAELHLAVGWRERACGELAALRERSRSDSALTGALGNLESACAR